MPDNKISEACKEKLRKVEEALAASVERAARGDLLVMAGQLLYAASSVKVALSEVDEECKKVLRDFESILSRAGESGYALHGPQRSPEVEIPRALQLCLARVREVLKRPA
jgi:hypothetical protein